MEEVNKYFVSMKDHVSNSLSWNWNTVVGHVKTLLGEMPSRPSNLECPDCGGEMISRKGQYGMFWGCKKYPNCRGTRDSEGRSKAERDEWKAKQEVTHQQGYPFRRGNESSSS